ncbi:hypothetical protein [Streptomyces yaizuensis]|uniref:Uncharacterized protein n=1 Tax=Streptomyces yaizuensis TaxID=2989713 RepID=A0ABQ5NTB7_9ACTN|nr:hypothetical protein [Streptomyces sp. YSPA8]GLF93604.1 hypothetical protein SYYSPA8_04925 [Streptomyces sp. YSPA8]
MIASTPVGRWTWGDVDESADDLRRCLRALKASHEVLVRYQLSVGMPTMRLSVTEAGSPKSILYRGEFPLDAGVDEIAGVAALDGRPGEVGSVSAQVDCAGVVAGYGEDVPERELFSLDASAFADFTSVDLATFSDVWMAHDLRGNPQPDVYAANAPRLAGALRGIAVALGWETDPEDPTYFAVPTESGLENHVDPDGSVSDTWYRGELIRRWEEFRHAPGFGRIGYRRSVEGEVQYVAVRREEGVLGHLWASDQAGAASFEPLDVDDEETYRAAQGWLERLMDAHGRGLTPSEALRELTGLSAADPVATIDLATLRERSSWE